MDGKTFVGLCDQLLIEAVLAYSRLVTSDQQNCLSPRVESKSHSPDPARCIKSKLLHVGMLRSLQRVPIGASEQRPLLCKNRGGRHARPFTLATISLFAAHAGEGPRHHRSRG